MQKLSMSISPGDRAGKAHNLDSEYRAQEEDKDPMRTPLNVPLRDEDLKTVYDELFGESLAKYNADKVAKGRANEQIPDYLKHIKSGKQEQEAYELVIQFGDMETFPATDEQNRKLAEPALKDFFEIFEKKYPNFRIYQSAIHHDEATPHLHIAYVPVFENHGAKRGLEVRTAHRKAFQQMGYKDIYELNDSMFESLEEVGRKYGIEREIMYCNRRHLPVREFKAHIEEIKEAEKYPYNNDPALVNALEYMADKQEKQAELIEQYQTFAEHVQDASVFEFKDLKSEAEQVTKAQKRLFPEWPKIKAAMQQVSEAIQSVPKRVWAAIIHPVGSEQRKEALALDEPMDLESAISASVRASEQLKGTGARTRHDQHHSR